MFHYISGTLTYLENTVAVVDAGGIGYRMTVSGTTYDALPRRGTDPNVRLYTYLSVREDGIELFGFATEQELATFKLLISVSGIGPKAAMSILTLLTPERFALAVCTEDRKTIAKANGIGPKTAARVILELKDKLMKEHVGEDFAASAPSTPAVGGAVHGKLSEATDALMVLGYSRAEALAALKEVDTSAMELEDIIRASLKKLMKY